MKLNPKYRIRLPLWRVTVNSFFNHDYHKGQIYKIMFKNKNKLYIGSSIRNLQERLQEHLTTKLSPVFKYKDDNPTIHLITLAPCNDRQDLNKLEIEYIRQWTIDCEQALYFSLPLLLRFALVSCSALVSRLRAKYRVCPAWLIKRLSCRLNGY